MKPSPDLLRSLICGCLLTLLALPAFGAAAAEEAPQPSLVGSWQGTLDIDGAAQLRLLFHVTETEDGQLAATLDSPDQGASGIPVSAVTVEGDAVLLELASLGAEFAGRFAEQGEAIEGEWRQSGRAFPLTIERREETVEDRAGG